MFYRRHEEEVATKLLEELLAEERQARQAQLDAKTYTCSYVFTKSRLYNKMLRVAAKTALPVATVVCLYLFRICFTDVKIEDMYTLEECDHRFCFDVRSTGFLNGVLNCL